VKHLTRPVPSEVAARLCCDRRWVSQSQLLFVFGRIDEIGKMAGGWSKQIQASSGR
jgi:hypothetical protein